MKEEDIQHVYPINDDGEHVLVCRYMDSQYPHCPCPCRPKYIDTENGGQIVVHNSYDGREGVEWVNEILK